MTHYLLSTFAGDTAPDTDGPPPTPQDMQTMMETIVALEAEMESSGAFVFAGRLHAPDAATVVRSVEQRVTMTDGPFIESKEHLAGFYVIDVEHLDNALEWAGRVSSCIGRPIEVQPFAGTGKVVDQMPQPSAD